jgi:hypothetical protein
LEKKEENYTTVEKDQRKRRRGQRSKRRKMRREFAARRPKEAVPSAWTNHASGAAPVPSPARILAPVTSVIPC